MDCVCDCSIGYPYSYNQVDEVKRSSTMSKELCDRRKNQFRWFEFCPDCGSEIDWKDIKSKAK